MAFQANYFPYTLRFKFDAGTSRGILKEKKTFFVRIQHPDKPGIVGWGEAALLKGLSWDDRPDFEEKLANICLQIGQVPVSGNQDDLLEAVRKQVPAEWPAIRFGLETAFLDWYHGGKRKIFENGFYVGDKALPINGLIWMGTQESMRKQIDEKLAQGFTCIKMKIGSLDFDRECELIASVRKHYASDRITLRVDANGAFRPEEALSKLQKLAEFQLHSIEQPIAPHQWDELAELCQISPVAIALDEELIGKNDPESKQNLLEKVRPSYIILKPSLVGGFPATQEWIQIAEKLGIGWWITSALESNIGLNAICQFTADYEVTMPQGLGTGGLFHNNIPSPLELQGEKIFYNPQKNWEISF